MEILEVMGKLNSGGAESLVINLYEEIKKGGKHCVSFAEHGHPNNKDLEKKILDNGDSIYFFPEFKIYNYFKYKKAVKIFFEKHHFDIVHGHLESAAFIYLKEAKKQNIKTIIHSHNSKIGRKGIVALIKMAFFVKMRKYADIFMSCGYDAACNRFGKKIADKKTIYLNNCINIADYSFDNNVRSSIRRLHGINEDSYVIGIVGRIVKEKNHKFAIKLFNLICKKNPNTYLMILGAGPLEKSIRKMANKSPNCDKIIFTGIVDSSKYYNAFDVLIMPSSFEGFPLTLIEASANGLTSVVSDKLPKETRFCSLINVIRYNEINDWATKISGLMKEKNINRRTIPQEVDNYNVKNVCENYISILEKI